MKTLILTALLFSLQAFASEENVATVLIKRGDIMAKLPDGKEVMLTVNQKLPVGTTLQTKDKSFVKLIFADKSTMNLGPSSQMIIQSYPKKEAGIIKLMSGQIRAEVSKNYMQIEDKSKSKLFIQTKSASMGIRGTDFQVNYNPENDNSSLIVFEGKVAMGSIDRNMADQKLDQKKLEEIVSGSTAVMVRQGQFSAVNHALAERPLLPTKLAPKQLDVLKDNTTGLEDATSKETGKKRSIVPPGLESSTFINAPSEVVKAEMKDAEGFSNAKTGEFKPAAGAMIDLKNVAIIEPPKGATFDPASKTFSVASDTAKVNEKTGQIELGRNVDLSKNATSTAPIARSESNASSGSSKADAPTAAVADAPKKADAPAPTASLVAEAPKKVEAQTQEKNQVVTKSSNDDASRKMKDAEDTAKKQKEDADKKAKDEADKKAKDEADRKAKDEADRKAKDEADRKAKDEADRKAKDEADRKAKDESDRKAKEAEEVASKAKKDAEDTAKKLKEEADKRQKEIDDALQSQRDQDEKNKQAKADAEKKQKEESDRQAREKLAKEQADKKAKEAADLAAAVKKKLKEIADAAAAELAKLKAKKENRRDDHHDDNHRSNNRDPHGRR